MVRITYTARQFDKKEIDIIYEICINIRRSPFFRAFASIVWVLSAVCTHRRCVRQCTIDNRHHNSDRRRRIKVSTFLWVNDHHRLVNELNRLCFGIWIETGKNRSKVNSHRSLTRREILRISANKSPSRFENESKEMLCKNCYAKWWLKVMLCCHLRPINVVGTNGSFCINRLLDGLMSKSSLG